MEFIPEIRAREKLEDVTVSMYPLMQPDSQRELFSTWLEQAGMTNTPQPESVKKISWDQVRYFLGARN